VQSLVKVWFNLQEDDDYRDSFNIASFTDNGTGDFTHTFTNSMSNANFAFTTGTNGSGSATGINSYALYQNPATTGAGLVRAKNIESGGNAFDIEYIMGMVGGDLA
jgi:ABC-type lipoprotein export system ATPase subunit